MGNSVGGKKGRVFSKGEVRDEEPRDNFRDVSRIA